MKKRSKLIATLTTITAIGAAGLLEWNKEYGGSMRNNIYPREYIQPQKDEMVYCKWVDWAASRRELREQSRKESALTGVDLLMVLDRESMESWIQEGNDYHNCFKIDDAIASGEIGVKFYVRARSSYLISPSDPFAKKAFSFFPVQDIEKRWIPMTEAQERVTNPRDLARYFDADFRIQR